MRRTLIGRVSRAALCSLLAASAAWGGAEQMAVASVVGTPAATATASATCPPLSSSTTPAQRATATASYTASWNSLAAISDGTAIYTGGSQSQIWGTYSANRPAQNWLEYDWSGPATLTGSSVAFWHDQTFSTAGDGVAVPQAWRVQQWTGSAWVDIALQGGGAYPTAQNSSNAVTFAAPVTTTKLRALFDATTNGSTYAAMGVSEWSVDGSAPEQPGAGLQTLSSSSFQMAVSQKTGGVYQIANSADTPTCTNYVLNPTSHPAFDIDDSRWVGDVVMTANGAPMVTGLSDDIRTVSKNGDAVQVSYAGNAANQYGLHGLSLTESYALGGTNGDALNWSLTLNNTTAQPMEIQDLGLPMLMNSWWDAGDQTSIYEQNVARHSFIAEDGSYAYWQRPNGVGPFLVMVPNSGTSLEFKDKTREGEGPFQEVEPSWEGAVQFNIHSKALQPARAGKITGYLPATSETIAPGAQRTYGFTFRWAQDYQQLHDVLYDAGVVDTVSLPGMVIPQDMKATLAVRAKDGIDSITGQDGKGVVVTSSGTRNGYQLYQLQFTQQGPANVTVTYGGVRTSVLQYNSIAPIEQLISTHAQFLVDHQQAKAPGRGYDGAFLQWDMSRQQLLTWDNYPGGGWRQWMAGGADDLGLAPAEFLSEQNTLQPNTSQIASVDYYIQHFLLGYLQSHRTNGQRDWTVYRWYDGQDGTPADQGVWRAYNYVHIANTYFNMFRIKSTYPATVTAFTADQYLMMAYNTFQAMFTEIPQPTPIGDAANTLGLMGESTYPDVLTALTAAGHTSEASTLRAHLQAKEDVFAAQKYPFASEQSIDTTGFESTYTLAKMFGNKDLQDKSTLASLAARGMQPLWYYYGSDNRNMGESWWNLGYETQLGAWQQQDYLQNATSLAPGINVADAMRSTYGAYLAGWSNVNTGQISPASANRGAASWQYQSQGGAGEANNWAFMPMLNNWWAWSGEADLGFWGGLRTASVNIVDDPIVGLYGYGGDVSLTNGSYTITPKDGVRSRLTLYNDNRLSVGIDGAKYTSATIRQDLTDLNFTLQNVTGASYSPTITINNLPAGTYSISADGASSNTFTSDGHAATATLTNLNGQSNTVHVFASTTTPTTTATVTLTSTSPVNANGWYRTPVTVAVASPQGGALTAQYSLDAGPWRSAGAPVTVKSNAMHTLATRLVDANRQPAPGSTATTTFGIDSGSPTATILAPVGLRGTPRNPVTLQWQGGDSLSGVAAMTASIDSSTATPVSDGATTLITAVGSHTVAFTVTDMAGNSKTTNASVTITADPVTTITMPKTMNRGQYATIQVSGFIRYENVTITAGATSLGQVVTDVNGRGSLTLKVPTGLPIGQQTLTASGASSGLTATSRPVIVR